MARSHGLRVWSCWAVAAVSGQRIRVYKDRESRWWCTALADGYVVCSRTWREAYETALNPRRWWVW